MMHEYELIIETEKEILLPTIQGGVKWETTFKSTPGSLTFTIVQDGMKGIEAGNAVRFKKGGYKVFYGFIFKLTPNVQEKTIQIVAYDQMRYFKNKDTYVYENITATELVKTIAADYGLNVGYTSDTKYKIPSRVEDGQTLFDIVETALDITLENTGYQFFVYDEAGGITIRETNSKDCKLPYAVTPFTTQSIDYSISIDGETYNYIHLYRDNEETGKRDVYIAKDSSHINKWGYLSMYESVDENVDGAAKADALLGYYNLPVRSLTAKGVYGNTEVRAGFSVPVFVDLGDKELKNYMFVMKAVHTFEQHRAHFMDLTLRGGEIHG